MHECTYLAADNTHYTVSLVCCRVTQTKWQQ